MYSCQESDPDKDKMLGLFYRNAEPHDSDGTMILPLLTYAWLSATHQIENDSHSRGPGWLDEKEAGDVWHHQSPPALDA